MIVRRKGKYCLLSRKSRRNLGCYRTREGAEKREREVQYFKSHPRRREVRVRPHRRQVYATHKFTHGIPRGGVLVPPRERKTRGHFYALDEALGDDEYIFLSLESIHPTPEKGEVYFFDAERLIREGALLRKKDIAVTREWDAVELYLGQEDAYTENTDEEYTQQAVSGIQRLVDDDPEFSEMWDALLDKREELTLRGAAAIEYLRQWTSVSHEEFGLDLSPEILVSKHLPLSESVGVLAARRPR